MHDKRASGEREHHGWIFLIVGQTIRETKHFGYVQRHIYFIAIDRCLALEIYDVTFMLWMFIRLRSFFFFFCAYLLLNTDGLVLFLS